jgi:hypothetical protein
VAPMFIPAVWKLHKAPRVHIFLWLLSQNKLITRDNMKKIYLSKPECCIFYAEDESIDHLFFKCIVARHIWQIISDFFTITLGDDYISIAKIWIANKKTCSVKFSLCYYSLVYLENFVMT